ncbi:hypothetical protein [Pediococcus pentosaceus]|uniref:hypothetical protein n=1 Tax=Pediococcus pentosaceus TaxID=1255 RepID=UPI0039827805
MVKQGNYAKRIQQHKIRQIKQRKPKQSQQQLKNRQELSDYLLVRYHLTQSARVDNLVEETMGRFIQVLIANLTKEGHSVNFTTMVQVTLQGLANQVPWQYYALLVNEWANLQSFLRREMEHAPLAEAIILEEVDVDMVDLVATQLAVNWYLTQFENRAVPVTTINEEKVAQLKATFIKDTKINWTNVQTVYSTAPFKKVRTDYDLGTQTWLKTLSHLNL